MEEEYKVIPGFDNYQISNFGNIKNIKTSKSLKPWNNGQGYLQVDLCQNGKSNKLKIHRLVAESFIPNIDNKNCVDHIDRVRDNNCVNNLRWATKEENSRNKSINKNNTSTCSGVSYLKRNKKWMVRICIEGKEKYIGSYCNFEEAVKMRKEQEEIYYKEFKAI